MDAREEREITGIKELASFAKHVLSTLSEKDNAHVVALHGELGSGKTAFTQVLAELLGVREHVTSPTFVIMKKYETHTHPHIDLLVHIDAYRIEEEREMQVLGFKELLSRPRTLVCIEWAERISELIPKDALRITFRVKNENTRIVTYGNN